jgi:NADPH:quinone reductase-like Zn-dependent oxidoreductase
MRIMHAVVLRQPGPVDNLRIEERPILDPQRGWVRIKVMAFGLNRSELHTRLGLSKGVTFPRVLGIEAVGVVDAAPATDLEPGQQVVTMLGGMGRVFDGGYAEYTVVPRRQVIRFHSELPWEIIGAVPQTLQTAYGSLTTGLDLQPGQTLLVRGGTSSVGLAAITVAKDMDASVIATTRQPDRVDSLLRHGADRVVLDTGKVASEVRSVLPNGVDAALELVGAPTLQDTLLATRVHGTVCFTGMLSNQWIVKDFYPIAYIPRGVRLTSYAGGSADLPPEVLQRYLDRLEAGTASLGPIRVHVLEGIREAHADLEHNHTFGKHVVLPHHQGT